MREIKGETSQNKGSDYDGLDKDHLLGELIFLQPRSQVVHDRLLCDRCATWELAAASIAGIRFGYEVEVEAEEDDAFGISEISDDWLVLVRLVDENWFDCCPMSRMERERNAKEEEQREGFCGMDRVGRQERGKDLNPLDYPQSYRLSSTNSINQIRTDEILKVNKTHIETELVRNGRSSAAAVYHQQWLQRLSSTSPIFKPIFWPEYAFLYRELGWRCHYGKCSITLDSIFKRRTSRWIRAS